MADVLSRHQLHAIGGFTPLLLHRAEVVRDGMYRPLGSGDVDVAAIVGHLRRQGYDGWYVLEHPAHLGEQSSRPARVRST